MASIERVTVTLPGDIIRDIDRLEKNRSRFVLEAVRHELDRRQRAELRLSLRNPHIETSEYAGLGFSGWAAGLPEDDEGLVDLNAGSAVQWLPGKGWTEGRLPGKGSPQRKTSQKRTKAGKK